jgi:hypothetical protein
MTIYEILIEYILPVFADFSLYDGVMTEFFYKCFCALATFVVLYAFIWFPFKFIRSLCRRMSGDKRK